jgi:hypothetical protein
MAAMNQPVRFILGHGAVSAAAPRAPSGEPSQPVAATPTASARRSAAQPKSKRRRVKR